MPLALCFCPFRAWFSSFRSTQGVALGYILFALSGRGFSFVFLPTQGDALGFMLLPFQGVVFSFSFFPGRCPGLYSFCPFRAFFSFVFVHPRAFEFSFRAWFSSFVFFLPRVFEFSIYIVSF